MTEIDQIKKRWNLAPLPGEGGFFAQTWRGGPSSAQDRPLGTAILFLITRSDFSALHALDADEVWHFHAGDPVEHVQIHPGGGLKRSVLGPDILTSHAPQTIAAAGSWQGARLAAPERGWALVGCTMAPGWSEHGTRLAERRALLETFPQHAEVIHHFTRATV